MVGATITRAAARPSAGPLPRRGRLTGGWALAAGLLWPLYGWFEMSTPFGLDTVYDGTRGYEVVIDRGLFAVYSLPGALALCATAVTLLHVAPATSKTSARWARGLARLVIGLAAVGVLGIVLGVVPLFFAPQAFGTPLLGAAAWLAGGAAATRVRSVHLRCLGIAALVSLGLWPAVWAVEILTPAAGVVLMGVFGIGWAALAADPAATTPRSGTR